MHLNKLALFMSVSPLLYGSIVFTHEAPGVQQTTVTGATVETFDSQPLGLLGTYISPIGTYSPGAAIVGPDAFGGAGQTDYISVGVQSGTFEYDLTFSGLRTYFGFYWDAGDDLNRLDFYEGATLQGTFAIGDIIPTLTPDYFGNPNTGQDPAEPYVFLNFTSSDLASRFDRVVFRNPGFTSGFETDNHSVFDVLIPPPGVPEPASAALIISGFVVLWIFVSPSALRRD